MSSQKLEAQVKARLQVCTSALEKTQSTLKDYSWLSLVPPPLPPAPPPPPPPRNRARCQDAHAPQLLHPCSA